MNQVAHCRSVRARGGKQRFSGQGMGAEVLTNKVGNPLSAGEIQIFFRAEVIGNSSNILPRLRGDIAGRGVQTVLAKLRERCGNQLIAGLLPLLVVEFIFCGRTKLINRLINFMADFSPCPAGVMDFLT